MKNILVVSDTHRRLENLKKAVARQKDIDLLLHLGDVEGQLEMIRKLVSCPVHCVRGNCDYDFTLPQEKDIEIEGHHIFMSHGHLHGVGFSTESLLAAAKRRGADIALFGHTHVPYLAREDGVTLLNPGSISLPRQANRAYTYALIEIDGAGEAHYILCEL